MQVNTKNHYENAIRQIKQIKTNTNINANNQKIKKSLRQTQT